jgi:SWI/SNF-related matrix-associated actin-dependent regulator 1 of chromatin subfamily A
MNLDFNPGNGRFWMRLSRAQSPFIQDLINKHGLDFFAEGYDSVVLSTDEPYAAVSFFDHATEAARVQLQAIQTEIDASWAADSQASIRCPADQELWGFQRASIAYALQRKHCLVGDQPGLGKTPIAICFANEIRAKRILCIVPASIRLQWVKRIRGWTTLPWPYKTHMILSGKHGVADNANWTVVSYELAASPAIGKALARGRFDLLILDEAHYLKTVDTRRTRAVFGGGENRTFEALASRTERIMALTGTPLPNRPREAYTLARGLCFDAIDWASEDRFRERFNPSIKMNTIGKDGKPKIWIDERSGRHAELQNRLRGNFMVRHEKHGPRGVMKQLKMPIFDLIYLDESKPVKQALAAEKLLGIDPENLEGADAETFGHVAVVRRQMGVAMAPQVADWVDMLIEGGEEKLCVFAWHIEVLDILEERWARHGVVRIDGSTSSARKERLVEQFVSEPRIKIALGNMLSMGVGTDGLQKVCAHGLIAEPDWVFGNNQQAFDRLDRGGQRHQVQADIFTVPGSFSEKVLAKALRKGQITHAVLDGARI